MGELHKDKRKTRTVIHAGAEAEIPCRSSKTKVVERVMNEEKMILDVTCGDRTIWFQKNEPHTIYCDKRREEWEGDFGKTLRADGKQKHRHLVIDPDVQCDFTRLPFADDYFSLVVFDPPHVENLTESSWIRKSYGTLEGDWKPMIRQGFTECMRVLREGGCLCLSGLI